MPIAGAIPTINVEPSPSPKKASEIKKHVDNNITDPLHLHDMRLMGKKNTLKLWARTKEETDPSRDIKS